MPEKISNSLKIKPKKIKIGYTAGDLGGIGLEIFNKFHTLYQNDERIEIILVDNAEAIQEFERTYQSCKSEEDFKFIHKPGINAGKHAISTLKKANQMALDSEIDYLVTGPVSKESLAMAGDNSSGQTEFLAKENKLSREEIEMFFVLDEFRVVLATRHVALKDVPSNLKLRFEAVLENSLKALKHIWKLDRPRIAICGLNPHAGENGILGKEETQFMRPIIKKISLKHPELSFNGPISSDFVLAKSARQYIKHLDLDYDLHIAAYHDQALPLIKGLGGYKSINLTAGLPYIRVSVDHGTGFDIAGKNIANPQSLISCTEYLIKLSKL